MILLSAPVRSYIWRLSHKPNVPFHLKVKKLQLHGFLYPRKSVLQLQLGFVVWFGFLVFFGFF